MGYKSFFAGIWAARVVAQKRKEALNAVALQKKTFQHLIRTASNTVFGKEHRFEAIKQYEDYKQQVPIRTYEDFRPYIERIFAGEKHVLWTGLPIYFSKTSGTTSGAKYIPITKDSIGNHMNSARNSLFFYLKGSGNTAFFDGKMMFLSGSPVLDNTKNIPIGRLSGIVNHHIPAFFRSHQVPTYETNCIEDWEKKLDTIIDEAERADLRVISGIPSWLQMFFERINERKGKKVSEIFPNFSLMVCGGVNYEPYRSIFESLIGKKIDTVQLYPASEGFFAYQDTRDSESMLLNVNDGIFYEFVRSSDFGKENAERIPLWEVEVGENYALIISTNAGLWAYNTGDIVQFVSKNPYRVLVTGRLEHFTSAFGEHVIASEVEQAMSDAIGRFDLSVKEFTVAPNITPKDDAKPYHEWFVEFDTLPTTEMEQIEKMIDNTMQNLNIYYKDLIEGNILQPLKIRKVEKGAFISYMKSQGKLGGQNKIPRLANHRKIADVLETKIIE